MKNPKITFIGAGSSVFMKNLIGDCLHKEALQSSHFALVDIDETRLNDSVIIIEKLIQTMKVDATFSTHLNSQKEALEGSDFVIVAFQIGGYKPCTVTDFEVCKKHGIEQTIGDTLGVAGIMRGIRTIPHLWKICEDMREVCPNATMLNYVNPMAMNTWAMYEKYPDIQQVGLCHSVPLTIEDLAHDLSIDAEKLRYVCAGINHMAFYLTLEKQTDNGDYTNVYPDLLKAYHNKIAPKPNQTAMGQRCPNLIRYAMFEKLGYFVTESSEHFAEYTPYFIKPHRPDLIKQYQIPLDEYLVRCEENIAGWDNELEEYKQAEKIEIQATKEYASSIMESIWTGKPSVINGNVRNDRLVNNLNEGCCVEVPCLVDNNGIQPTHIGRLPTHLAALMRTNINVQELVVEGMIQEKKESIYHAALLDPHTASVLGIDDIYRLVDELIEAHGDWLPEWIHR